MSVRKAGLCQPCATEYDRAVSKQAILNARVASKESYEEWLKRIRALPKDYPRLTELQWLHACRYFGGCALCGSPDITTRHLWIPAKDGGRYCDWNVVPLCEDCFKKLMSTEKNAVERANATAGSASWRSKPLYKARHKKIWEYLKERLPDE